ncbi:MAG: hypothetical protein ACOYY2_11210 [Actinomycetota bacterium]
MPTEPVPPTQPVPHTWTTAHLLPGQTSDDLADGSDRWRDAPAGEAGEAGENAEVAHLLRDRPPHYL